MRDLSLLLKKKTIDYNKLEKFGFAKEKDNHLYKERIMNGSFEVQIFISKEKMYSKVIDIENNTEYALVDVEDAVGEFIGCVRAEYDKILNKFIKECTDKEVFKSEQSKMLIKYIQDKYGDELEFLWEKYDDNAIWRNKKSNKWYATLFSITGDKLGLKDDKNVEVSNVMIQKDKVEAVIDNKIIFPAYHMNKKSWITIKLDKEVNMDMVYELVDNSYEISSQKKTKNELSDITMRVMEYLLKIPKGRVVTYGQIAKHLGNKDLARAVGNALHKNPDGDKYPCYKVVNNKGELAKAFVFGGVNVQKQRLEKDGIEVIDNKVDLKIYQWEE